MKRHRRSTHPVAFFALVVCAIALPAAAQDCPELVGWRPYGPSYAVAVSGSLLYLGAGTTLLVFDVADPETPQMLGEAYLTGSVRDIAVMGDYAYVAGADAGLVIVDISDPAAPAQIGSLRPPFFGIGVAVVGDYAYVADNSHALRVIDISNPSAPFEVGFLETLGTADGIAVVGDYAYLADGDAGLLVIDVSNPAAPVEVGVIDTPAYADGVVVAGDYAYVADGASGLVVIDIRNPSMPLQSGFLDLPDFSEGIAWDGAYVYVADHLSGLWVVDVSNPAAPSVFGTIDTPGVARGVAVAGDHAYVADYEHGLRVVDISTASAPHQVAWFDTRGPAMSVAVAGNYAYEAAAALGLQIVDVSNPTAPVPLGSVDTPDTASGITVQGDYAYVADMSSLRIVNVSNPAAPYEVGAYTGLDYVQDVAVAGGHAYIADPSFGLHVVDVSEPSAPEELGAVTGIGGPWDVEVLGNYAYVAARGRGLRIVDVSNPAAPFETGFYDTPGRAMGVALSGRHAYVADTSSLQVIDVSDPAHPVWLGSCATPAGTYSVAVAGSFAYLATFLSGLWVIDISDPSAPVVVASYDTAGRSYVATVADGYVYLADYDAGVEIFRQCGGDNSPPAVLPIEDQVVDEGDPMTLNVVAVDPDGDPLTYSAIGVPPGATLDPVSGEFAYSPGYDVSTSDANTSFEVTFVANDGRGGIGTASVRITVNDVDGGTPPGDNVEVTPVDPDTGTENESIDLTFSGVDTGGITSATTVTNGAPPPTGFRLGNNTYTEITTTAAYEPPIHICIDYSSFGITGERETRLALYHFVALGGLLVDGSLCSESNGCWDNITDPDNSPEDPNPDTLNDIICGTSNSLSPFAIVEAIEITAPLDPIQVNSSVPASMDLGEPLTADEAVWDWDDGTQDIMAVTTGMIEANHAFSEAGIFIPRVTLRHAGSQVGSAEFRYLVVYDPEGGFVTGGGWIDSPAGAYVPDPTLTGRANFGFVSKYKRGASAPTGNTEFRFQAADLEFHSTSYQWLVIANHKAIYKGDGTINGEGGHGFLISAIDGDLPGGGGADKFRIKIWDKATEEIVYDNQMGANDDAPPNTVIGGGSIVIHR